MLHNLLTTKANRSGPNVGQCGPKLGVLHMAYIETRKHPDGSKTYRVRIRRKGMPDKSETFPCKSKAQAWGRKMEGEVCDKRHFPRKENEEQTFAAFIDKYIELELPKKPKSYKKQHMQLLWWKQQLGDYFLVYVTNSMISELRDKLLSEKLPKGTKRTSSTTNRYLAALSHAYTVAMKDWGWVNENPVLKVRRPKENKPRERFLEKDEIERLLGECSKRKSPYIYPVVFLALATGARKGELLALKWSDIDFARARLTFRDTKNGESRSIHLSKQSMKCLEMEKSKRVIFSEYVFPTRDGKRPADIKTAWEAAVKHANLSICFHTLRHTAASQLAMRGATLLELAAILGHKTLAMVKRYSHLSVAATAGALDRMNEDLLEGSIYA